MNKEYLKEIYLTNKENVKDSNQEIKSFKEFYDYIVETVLSNVSWDFNIQMDREKLFDIKDECESEYYL